MKNDRLRLLIRISLSLSLLFNFFCNIRKVVNKPKPIGNSNKMAKTIPAQKQLQPSPQQLRKKERKSNIKNFTILFIIVELPNFYFFLSTVAINIIFLLITNNLLHWSGVKFFASINFLKKNWVGGLIDTIGRVRGVNRQNIVNDETH